MNCFKAEYLKLNRTFTKKLLLLMPLLTVLLSFVLMEGKNFQEGSYNWWYAILLPGMLTLVCAEVIQKDIKKLSYRAFLGLPVNPAKIWLGKLWVCVFLLFVSSLIFFLAVSIGGFTFGSSFTLKQSALASLTLFITFIWQIPMCMLLTDRFGLFPAVLINLSANIVCIGGIATSVLWRIPYSIPARLMCPVIHVLPNGLSVPSGDPLLSTDVILPGIIISCSVFVITSFLTALYFNKKEAR